MAPRIRRDLPVHPGDLYQVMSADLSTASRAKVREFIAEMNDMMHDLDMGARIMSGRPKIARNHYWGFEINFPVVAAGGRAHVQE